MSIFGYNGSMTFVCATCSRRINVYKDTIIFRSALTNGIVNATSASEEKIKQLKEEMVKLRAEWANEKALIEERDRAIKAESKRRDRHRNCVDRSVVHKIEHMNA